jgi:uncharacterized membrane protein
VSGLSQLFSYVCGQVNLWTPGGEALPFCQRCTGLYVGGAYAQLLWLLFRPRPTLRVLGMHAALLLLMIPFGYHLVPQGGEVRTLTGQLFAIGLTYFLALNPALRWRPWESRTGNERAYWAAMLAGLPLLLLAVRWESSLAAPVLAGMGVAGLIGFASLTLANLALLPLFFRKRFYSPDSPRS